MARRKDHSRDELKELILTASIQIINTDGVSALTSRRIASHIGYAPGTIYNVFPSMEDIILHVNGRTLDMLSATLNHPSCHNPRKSVIQNMKIMAHRYMDFASSSRPLWMALFSTPLDTSRYEYTWYKEKVDLQFEPLQSLLKNLTPTLTHKDCSLHTRILWSSVHGLAYLNATEKLPDSDITKNTKKLLDTLVDTYTAGILQNRN